MLTMSNVTMSKVTFQWTVDEWRIGKNVEGVSTTRGTIPGFTQMDREAWTSSVMIARVPADSGTKDFDNMDHNFYRMPQP